MKTLREIPGVKGVVLNMPWIESYVFGEGTGNAIAKDAPAALARIPLIYRAVHLRANSIARVPVTVYRGEDEAAWPYENTLGLSDLLWHCEAALMVCGASYTVRLRNVRREMGLQYLNPTTMSVEETRDGLRFTQQVGGTSKTWPAEEMFYLRNFSLSDDVGPGIAPAAVALTGAQSLQGVSRFAAQFFESGAMPVTMLSLPPGTRPDEKERAEKFFKSILRGVKNAFRIFAASGEMKVEQITPNLNTLDLSALDTHAINDVAWAFNCPKTLLTADSANYATADSEYRNFLLQTVGARCEYYEKQVNKLLDPLGLSIAFNLQELPELQKDEVERAEAFSTYVNAGMSKQLAAAMLGLEIPEDFQDFWTEEPEEKPEPEPKETIDQVQEEVRRWLRKASRRLREGKGAQVEFESKAIPQATRSRIYAALAHARTQADVHDIFLGKGKR